MATKQVLTYEFDEFSTSQTVQVHLQTGDEAVSMTGIIILRRYECRYTGPTSVGCIITCIDWLEIMLLIIVFTNHIGQYSLEYLLKF